MTTSKKAFFFALLLIAGSLIWLAPDAAVNVDEQLHYPHAKNVVNWYFTHGLDQSSLITPETNLKYYGQSVDNLTALLTRIFDVENEFRLRHYTGAFFFIILLLLTGLLAKRITNSWLVASITILSMVFMPRLTGQAFGNLKDIPFAMGYMAGLMMIIKYLEELPHPRWRTAVLLGMAIAFTVSVRAGGFILFGYLGIFLLVLLSLNPSLFKQIVFTKPILLRLLGQGLTIVLLGYFVGLIFWPYALQDVFRHPLESLKVMEQYKISIRQLFEGEFIWSTMLPWYYLPKWFMISTPLFALTGLLLFVYFFVGDLIQSKSPRQQTLFEGFLLFAFAFPLIYVIVIKSNLYSGVRQMLFVLPCLALMASMGIYKLGMWLYKSKWGVAFWPGMVLSAILLLWPVVHQVKTFPVDYVYFNEIAGGNKKAWSNYEYDYYYHGIKAPAEYLIDLVGDEQVTVAMNSNLSNYFDDYDNICFLYTKYMERSSYDWDYGIFGINYIHPYLLENNLWQSTETIKTIFHKGNPVAIIVKRSSDKTDFYGISEIKNVNLHHGMVLLEAAIENDPNNVWLYVYLAKAKYDTGDYEGYKVLTERARDIHPFYEPLILMEANVLFENEQYEQALAKLHELFDINPRYLPASSLYTILNNKMKLLNQ